METVFIVNKSNQIEVIFFVFIVREMQGNVATGRMNEYNNDDAIC